MMKNDKGLTPQTPGAGPTLDFEFPGLLIGTAEYEEGPTGCTVLRFPQKASSAVDLRGGSPGIIGGYGRVDAICFAGGSLYGLEAAMGVSAQILSERKRADWGTIATVSGAIIYDFGVRDNLIYPDKALGAAAYLAATQCRIPLGQRGAGRSASVGKIRGSDRFASEPAGQGAAFRSLGDLRIAVITIVNAMGAVLNQDGSVLRGIRDKESGRRLHFHEVISNYPEAVQTSQDACGENTTLTAVIVNSRLEQNELVQLGRQVHSAMARVIQPFHGLDDGDILFTLSTEEIDSQRWDLMALGELCSDLACKAVRTAVRQADGP